MKKIFTLALTALLCAAGASAQTVTVNKVDGTKLTYNASEITSIEFNPASDTTLIHSFTGYVLVSNAFMGDSVYYGDQAQMQVMRTGDQLLCRFQDATWGTGLFNITRNGAQISGTGKLKLQNAYGGTASSYDATMSGTMTNIRITAEVGRMGEVVIDWIFGQPGAYKTGGNYSAIDTLTVNTFQGQALGSFQASAPSTYVVKAQSDSTISITFPEENYTGVTMMGNVTIGTYTISNIAWDATQQAYVRDYHNDGLSFHFKSDSRDQDYPFSNEACKITVKPTDDGNLQVSNVFVLGNMPGTITASFTATKK